MNAGKTNIFLTGATGVMGGAGLKELMKFPELYHITVLSRETKKNKKKLKKFIKRGVHVIWGDLLDPKVIYDGLMNADIVLHVGGMVSPAADRYPEKTREVNVGSMRIIADIVKKIEEKDRARVIKVVYIGSVSQYGSKLPPNHWGSVGDAQVPAKMDAYAESKIESERILRESDLRKWVSLRQTAILHSGLLKKANNPTTFHVPLLGVLEWVTVEDSGRLLERVCRPEVPEEFWGKAYNIGGGEKFRLINIEFERGILQAMGCPPPEKIFETNWFATQNFHGIWFEDSEELDKILHYRVKDTFEDALKRMKSELPFYYKAIPLVPHWIIKRIMKKIASDRTLGTLSWVKNNVTQRIEAAWGGIENYGNIPDWENFETPILARNSDKIPIILTTIQDS